MIAGRYKLPFLSQVLENILCRETEDVLYLNDLSTDCPVHFPIFSSNEGDLVGKSDAVGAASTAEWHVDE